MFKKVIYKIEAIIRLISIWITRIIHFLGHDLWLLNEDDFSRWKARLVRDAKTVVLMMNTFMDQKISFQISALAYRSMLAVVPGIAIGLYLTDGFGLRERFAELLYANLGEEELIQDLLAAADNIVNTAESGLFGFISMASFVWIVISLMITVRQVFNNVWKVQREENILKTAGVIIGITVLAPFVVLIFFSGSVLYSHVLEDLFPGDLFLAVHLKSFMSWLVFAAVAVLVIYALYKYVPGTHVHSRHAFKAALLSGVAFAAVQYLYLETQMMVAKQSAVYGVLAAIPLFMVWLNLGWTIVLYGAELSYAFQNVDRHRTTIEMLDEMNAEAVRARKERFQNSMSI